MADPTPHLERFESYEQACLEFRWSIPQRFNIATAICRKHADSISRVALTEVKDGGTNTYTFGGLDFLSDKFAMALSHSGIARRDSVATILPESAALAIAHLGALKAAAVVVPLSMTWDSASLRRALADSNARALIVHESMDRVVQESRNLSSMESCFIVRDHRPAEACLHKDFWIEVDQASSDFENVETDASAPAFIFYSSSKGKLTGVLHSHASVIGQLTAFEMTQNLELDNGGAFWTDDWCSVNQLLGMIYPAWWYGCSIVAGGSLSNEKPQITVTQAHCIPEVGLVSADCARWFSSRLGSAGRVAPGRSVEIVDGSGRVLRAGQIGRLAVHRSDPALLSRNSEDAKVTNGFFAGDWFVTSDRGYKEEDGALFLVPSPVVGGEQ